MGKDDLIEAARLGNYPSCEKILSAKAVRRMLMKLTPDIPRYLLELKSGLNRGIPSHCRLDCFLLFYIQWITLPRIIKTLLSNTPNNQFQINFKIPY